MSQDFEFCGFVVVNVVGLQYYDGTFNGGESLRLVREPMNPDDENAIGVVDTRSGHVGHIEIKAANILAPLMDSKLIRAEVIVPKPMMEKVKKFKLSCQVHIYTHIESIQTVHEAISKGGFQLISQAGAAFTLSDAMVVKEKQDGDKETNKDELLKLLDEINSEREKLNILEPPTTVISSELMLHQKEALGWLVHQENAPWLPPFWKVKTGSYTNVLTNYKTNERPKPFLGGILADDTGLGKTLTLLSLVAYDKFLLQDPSSNIAEPCVEKKKSRGEGLKRKAKTEHVGAAEEVHQGLSKTTLIVCPPAVLSSWLSQIGEHVHKEKLKVYMYHGSDRLKDASFLQKHDIVLTTYQILATEESSSKSPMKRIEWRRVILDEAHFIRNTNAQQSKAVTKLNSKRRWVVSGTPIQFHKHELLPLMTFLKLEPFSNKSYWDSFNSQSGGCKVMTVLQVLMASICLRRTKEKTLMDLPSKTVETHFVDFSDEEREVYEKPSNSIEKAKPSFHCAAETKSDSEDEFDDEKPLSHNLSAKSNIVESKCELDDSNDDKPLSAKRLQNGSAPRYGAVNKSYTLANKRSSSVVKSSCQPPIKKAKLSGACTPSNGKKTPIKAETKNDDDDDDDIPISQKMKRPPVKSSTMLPGSGEGNKWTMMVHNGVIFPPPYNPHGVKMLYKNQPVDLTPEQEEVATMFAVMLDTDYMHKPRFKENFFNDWKKLLGKNHVIQKVEDCNFTPIYEWHQSEKEKKKQMTTEEKKALKEEKLKLEEKYMWAIVDGTKEKVGNFRVEPPGLFRGSREHPKMGKLRKRIHPCDITINIGKNAPVPECPIPGERWKEVRHDNTVTWLAYWNDPINPKAFKYVFLGASSALKGQSDKDMRKQESWSYNDLHQHSAWT